VLNRPSVNWHHRESELNRNPQARSALGRILRGWREDKGLSQEAFARQADLDRTYVGSVERGETNLSFEGVWQFLHALGHSWADLGAMLDREPALRMRPHTRTTRRG
jgi:transcriptional regulator with XRE-family HTH domain